SATSSIHNLNQHSFPTRRSSDLIKVPKKLLKENKVVGIFPSGTRTSEEVPLKRGAVTIAASSKVPIIPVAYHGPNNFKDLFKRLDRKSTRLNSSHVSISYAVFCL